MVRSTDQSSPFRQPGAYLGKILEMMDQENSAPPMRLRPGVQAARLMWAQQFKGDAVNVSSLLDADAPAGAPREGNRKVVTQAQ